jgi:tetratricopeptide (TPR) repeat protein
MALCDAGIFKGAIPLLEKAIRKNPKHRTWYLFFSGLAYLSTGMNEKAIAVFRKYVSRKPENADAHAWLGIALIAAGRPAEAVQMLEKALSLNPDRPSWYEGDLAVARIGAGKPEEAVKMMEGLVNRYPDNAETCRQFSMVLGLAGRHEEALQMAEKAVELMEKRPPIYPAYFYQALGGAYFLTEQYGEAITALKKVIRLWPEDVYGHLGLTASYVLVGRMDEARVEAKEVLRINPLITLESIEKNAYITSRKTIKERYINALRKAGLK